MVVMRVMLAWMAIVGMFVIGVLVVIPDGVIVLVMRVIIARMMVVGMFVSGIMMGVRVMVAAPVR